MNRIYKVVWNDVRQCYVVASELAKKQTKGCGKKMLAAILAAGIFSVTGTGSVWADPANPLDAFHYISISSPQNPPQANFNNDGAKQKDSIAIGAQAETGGNDTVAIGYQAAIISADALGNSSNSAVAVGVNSKVYNSVGGIAIGRQAVVGREPGLGTDDAEDFGIAIGYQASSHKEGIAVGGIGTHSGAYGTSIGTFSNTENVRFGTALGYNASATVNSGVALGAHSVAAVGARMGNAASGYDPATGISHEDTPEVKAAYQDLQTKEAAYNANQTTENKEALDTAGLKYRKLASPWRSTRSAVSVGNAEKGYTRQIVNVAAGTEDTDAVNVAQLKALNATVAADKTHYYSVNDDGRHVANYDNDGAKGGMALAAGAGAAANGTASTVTGIFSRVDGDGINGFTNGFQGATATAYGAFNTIGAKNGVRFDGVANGIVGVANKTENANAALIFGAGNKVTNSYRPVDMASAAPLANGLRTAIQTGNTDEMISALGDMVATSGGAVLAIGGANTADYAQASQLIGVGNKLKGADGKESKLNLINGYKNDLSHVNRVTVIGSHNTVDTTDDALVVGDYRKLAGTNRSVLIGSGTEGTILESYGKSVVAVGYDSNATKTGGVAVGQGAAANGLGAVAGGQGSRASLDGDIAIGKQAKTSDHAAGSSIAIGQEAETKGHQAIALGYKAESAQDSVVLGNTAKAEGLGQSVVVGWGANSKKEGAVSIGIRSNVNSVSGTALGREARTEAVGGVALGAESVADRAAFTTEKKGVFSEFDLNGKTAGAVSVGTANNLRQIINVGDATEDSDAVNLRQLKAVKDSLNTTITNNGVHYYSVKSDQQGAGTNYANDGATGTDSMVIGISSSSSGNNSTVLGNNNKLTGVKNGRNNSIVVGQSLEVNGVHNAVFATDYNNYDHKETKVAGEANTVLGVGNLVGWTAEKDPDDETKWIYTKNESGSDQNVAVGLTNTVNGGSVVVGTSSVSDSLGTSVGHGNTIIGMDDDGGQYGLALGNHLTVKGEEAIAIGRKSEATADQTIALGKESKAKNQSDIAMGYKANASGGWSMALGAEGVASAQTATAVGGYGAKATVDAGVALGSYSVADTAAGVSGYDPSTKAASTETGSAWKSTLGAVSVGDKTEGESRQITNVAAGTQDTDAVNVAQLKKLQETVTTTAGEAGKHTTVVAGDYVTVAEGTNDEGGKKYTVSGPQLTSADGTVTITDKVENGKKVGYNLSVDTAALGIEKTVVAEGENVTVTSSTDAATHTTTYTIAAKDTYTTGGAYNASTKKIDFTQNDATQNYSVDVSGLVDSISGSVNKGIDFAGDSGSAINKKMGETLEIKGGATELTENNIGVVSEGGALKVKLAKNITGVETLTVNEKITVGETTVGKDTVTTKTVETETVKAGDTTINHEGVSIQNGPSITKNNVDMHDQQIHNVADGTDKHDAATVGQVQKLQQEAGKEINRIDNRVDRLDSRVDKVGAGAAALAALHPVDFDADDKVDVAAGWGHYKGQNAMALGAFYRPDERTMFSIGGAFGNGENMVNAGVTFKLDKQPNGYHNITSKAQLVKQVAQLQADNKALMDRMKAMDEKMAKMEKMLEAK